MRTTTMGHLSMKPGRLPNSFLNFHLMNCVQETSNHIFFFYHLLTLQWDTYLKSLLIDGKKLAHIMYQISILTGISVHSLTLWGWVTYICVGKLTTIGSDNGLSPGRHQAIIWTNVGMLLIRPLGTHFSGILIEIQVFSLTKICLKMSSAKSCLFGHGPNVLMMWPTFTAENYVPTTLIKASANVLIHRQLLFNL